MIIRLDDDVSLTCSCIAHVPYAARDRHWRKGGVSIHSVHVYVDTRWQGGKVGEVRRWQGGKLGIRRGSCAQWDHTVEKSMCIQKA